MPIGPLNPQALRYRNVGIGSGIGPRSITGIAGLDNNKIVFSIRLDNINVFFFSFISSKARQISKGIIGLSI